MHSDYYTYINSCIVILSYMLFIINLIPIILLYYLDIMVDLKCNIIIYMV